MGLFVLGILFGWLLEWLFVKFVMRADLAPNNDVIHNTENVDSKANFEETSKTIAKSSAITSSTEKASKTAPKKAASKKTVPKKVKAKTTKSTAETKVKTKSKPKKAKFESGDDFTKLTGIGPKITLALHSVGITSFEQLSNTKDGQLQQMLEGTDVKIINKEIVTTWNEQALLANNAKWSELETLQQSLKK